MDSRIGPGGHLWRLPARVAGDRLALRGLREARLVRPRVERVVDAFQTRQRAEAVDVIAPDGSAIRLLGATARASTVHCTLAEGAASLAVVHRTVEEIWYVLGGRGEVWRRQGQREETTPVLAGTSLTIPVGTHFQFRCLGPGPLTILIATIPPWPGEGEAQRVPDHWPTR